MPALFSHMTVSRRLLVGSLAFALPLAVLAWFMDASFRFDLDVARRELAGSRYLRAVYAAAEAVEDCERLHPLADKGLDGAVAAEAKSRADRAMDALLEAHALAESDLGLTRRDLAQRGLENLHPEALAQDWRLLSAEEQEHDAAPLLHDLVALARFAAGASMLTQDPAPDSSALAKAVIIALPEALQHLAEIGLYTAAAEPDAQAPEALHDRLTASAALLRDAYIKQVGEHAHAALREDLFHYGASPTLASRFAPALERFQLESRSLAHILAQEAKSRMLKPELATSARAATLAGRALRAAGLDEMDVLVNLRRDFYRLWRGMGVGFSALALLLASVVVWSASRGVARDVRCLSEYAGQVAAGDYSAECRAITARELGFLYEGLRSMVDQIKLRHGFAQGLLDGLTVPCLVVDRSERLTYVNRPYFDLYQRHGEPQDYLGMGLAEFFYGDPGHKTITGRAMREGRPFRNIEMATTNAAGRTVHVRYDVAPLYDLDGQLIGAFAVIVDLTEIKAQQREIERLAAFPSVSPNPVLSAGAEGIAYRNPATAQFLEHAGLTLEQVLPEQHAEILAACLATGQSRYDVERRAGGHVLTWTYHPLPGQGVTHLYAADVTERRRAEEQLLHDAFHDGLTGLPNRTLFLDRAGQAARSAAASGQAFAVCLLDLDRFKQINDNLGHAAGDKLLAALAGRIVQHMRPGDTLARFSGDEFGILLDPVTDASQALALAESLHEALEPAFAVDGRELFVTAAIGIALGLGGENPEDLLRDADIAMFRAKSLGASRSVVFDTDMHSEASEQFLLQLLLKKAVEAREFTPYFQPLVDLAEGRIAGFEALVRWRRPGGELVPPGKFIPLAEETGLIVPLGEQMLLASFAAAKAWADAAPGLSVSVNLAVRQLQKPGIVEDVAQALAATGADPSLIKLEVTESGVMGNVAQALEVMRGLHGLGVSLAIDDFGTGYSSLSHLARFPFDFLKVDMSFVRAMHDNPESLAIVETIVGLAHSLGKQIIAEGVETPQQLAALRQLGCQYGQGYLFARPLPRGEAEALLQKDPRW
ncbi:MAG: EAL domain-containing protein [Thermodesulfobacteriota bacterium]